MIDEPCGVVVKYNPCTVYARKGSPCPYYENGRKCGKPPGSCDDPEYDLWYKEVLRSKSGSFYPNRIKLLETKKIPMFLYHSDKHAIVGEAEIQSYTKKDKEFHYRFNEFNKYPNPVELELLIIVPRLPKLAKIGRWRMVYINKDTLKTIRKLSKLDTEKRIKLDKNLENIIKALREKPTYTRKPTWKQRLGKIKAKTRDKGVNEQIITQATKNLAKMKKQDLIKGRSTEQLFYASLYAAYRQTENPKTIPEITEIANIDPKDLASNYRLLVAETDIQVPRIQPQDLIQKNNNLPEKVIKRAIEISQKIGSKKDSIGKAPSSIAAVSTYLACNMEQYEVTQKQIAEMYNTSTVMIRSLAKEYKLTQF